jgi:hypothetical protein
MTGVLLEDVTSAAGIKFRHENGRSEERILVETTGSGVAFFDYNNDGFLDLYFVNGAAIGVGARSPGNVLLRNTGKGTFVDVTKQVGAPGTGAYGMGVAIGDYDNDGFLDLYVTNYGFNQLYRNNGGGAFTDVTTEAGVAGGNRWHTSAGFFDYDNDGDLDLYVVNYLDYHLDGNPYCGLKKEGYRLYCDVRMFDGVADQLFRNNGDGTFTDVSSAAGIANPAGKGLGVTFGDFDSDGYVDIFVANDTVRNFLYHNNRDGTFTDVGYGAGIGYDPNGKPRAGMGVDCADTNGDGLLDVFVTNFSNELNALFENRGGLVFEEVTEKAGLGSSLLPLGFGTKLFDFDNDGNVDIFVANGHVDPNVHRFFPNLSYMQTPLLYRNNGNGTFTDVSSSTGSALKIQSVGRGAAIGDYDNDGDLDIVISNSGERPILMRNDGGNAHWIAVKARGKQSNLFSLGAKVRVEASGKNQLKEINNAASYLSSNDIRLYFGLGHERKVQRIELTWPSGKSQVLRDVPADQVLLVDEP